MLRIEVVFGNPVPLVQVGLATLQIQLIYHNLIKPAVVQVLGNGIDGLGI